MTVDKILVIVVLVFAVVFVVAAISGYTKVQDLRARNDAERNALSKDVSNKDLKINQLDGSNQDLLNSLNSTSKAKDDALALVADRDKTIADLQAQIAEKNKKIDELNVQIADFTNTIPALKDQVKTLNDTLQALIKERDDLIEKLRQANLDKDALNAIIKDKDKQIGDLNSQITDLKAEIERLKRGGEPGPTEFKLDCTVTDVKRDKGYALVSLDKGSKDKLKIDMKLFVWNSADGYKGRITIVEVHEDSAFAKIDLEEPGKEIKAGDTASVQNF